MGEQVVLNDICDDLLILNKTTLNKLFLLENADDCLVLYLFYYKTAKWQKTNIIKATDLYIQKSLKWGTKKILNTKKILKENGLIDIVQRRNNGKIEGWYVQINYLINDKKDGEIKIKIEEHQNYQKQELSKATSDFRETNAYNNNIKCLNNNNNINAYNKEKLDKKSENELFELFWKAYPKKKNKGNVEKWFEKNKPSKELVEKMIMQIERFKDTNDWKKNNGQFIPYPSSWLNAKAWEDEIETDSEREERIEREIVGRQNGI